MSLEEATERLLASIEAQDLDEFARALEARQAAISGGATPTAAIVEAGERAALALVALKQQLAFESAHLTKIQAGLAAALDSPAPNVDCEG